MTRILLYRYIGILTIITIILFPLCRGLRIVLLSKIGLGCSHSALEHTKYMKVHLDISIDKSSSIPLYIQVENLLKELITNGYFEKCEFPITEKDLEEQLGVSRNTVRQAISKLVDQGLLVRKRAHGIRSVKNSSQIMGETTNGLSFTEAALKRGQVPSSKLLQTSIIDAPKHVASKLYIENGEKVFYNRRMRSLDGVPASVTDSYVPVSVVPRLSTDDFSESGLSQSLHYILERKHNVQILKWVESIEAINISKKDAEILHIRSRSPVLLRKDVVYSTEGKIIAYNETIMTANYKIEGLVYIKERL